MGMSYNDNRFLQLTDILSEGNEELNILCESEIFLCLDDFIKKREIEAEEAGLLFDEFAKVRAAPEESLEKLAEEAGF